MKKKTAVFSILGVSMLVVIPLLLRTCGQHPQHVTVLPPTDDRISQVEPSVSTVLPSEPGSPPEVPPETPGPGKRPRKMARTPTPQPRPSSGTPQSTEPTQLLQAEPAVQRVVPKPPPIVLPSEDMGPIKLCGGEMITHCGDVGFTHSGFALLLLDILTTTTSTDCGKAFEILGSLNIAPADGWAESNPQKRLTPEEMEEVRCSISLAFEDGLIQESPSVVTASLNRFCTEWVVSVQAVEESAASMGRLDLSTETGYQGGTEGVASSPF